MRKISLCIAYLALGGGLLSATSYQGNFDSANCGGFTGWAWDTTGQAISVDIYDGTTYLTTTTANVNTGADSYQGGGWHGFSVPAPASLKDNQVHNILARFGGTTINVASAPDTGSRAIQCNSSATGYRYYYTDTLQSIVTNNWTQNGTIAVLPTWGLGATTSGGGSLISTVAVQGPSLTNYEVNMTLALKASGGTYVAYLRASTDALTGQGTYFSVELQNPTFDSSGACTATVAGLQRVNGTVTQLYSAPVACHDGMQVRTVIVNNMAQLLVNGAVHGISGVTVTSGMPGIGGRSMPSGNAITLAEFGPQDNLAPSPVNASSFEATVYATSVTAYWQGSTDDSNGVGVSVYVVTRNDGTTIYTYDASFYDATVQPNTTYSYSVSAHDFHSNAGPVSSFTITTPPAGAIDPRRIGVRPAGSYWGSGGEQIDLLSGNLNYSLPLIHAVGRGLSATFALSYNSQNWRTGSGNAADVLTADMGFGFGWQFMLGSLMPVYGQAVVVQYYLFTDSTGAQYRLNQHSGSVWSSTESVFVWYDASANRLYFRDGTFWLMGCISAGGEPDAGTLYPTIVESTNGNQIIVHYLAGVGVNWVDSSARISTIEDARAVAYTDYSSGTGVTLYHSYAISYAVNANGLSYPYSITSYIDTHENYTIAMDQGVGIYSPGGVSFGTAGLLKTITATGPGYYWQFTYSGEYGGTDGDLTQVQFPQGGQFTWGYTSFTYSGNRSMEEVNHRYLTATNGGTQTTYTFVRNDASNSVTVHSAVALDDASGAEKYWLFNTNTGTPWNLGLVSELQHRSAPNATPPVRDELYTWVQNAASNAYIGTVQTTLDSGHTYAETSKTVQTRDSYGNVLTSSLYDYGNLSTPARTYTNTYLHTNNTNYSSRYILNRLLSSTLTSVTPNLTLVSNNYDFQSIGSTSTIPREWDSVNYGTSFYYRGNVSTSSSPGKTVNTGYDYTGNVVSQYDSYGHSVNLTTSTATNYALPDALTPNGTTSLQTSVTYNTNFAPAGVAAPYQTLYDPSSQTGTSAYTSYDSYGRVAYTLAPAQTAGSTGAKTTYNYTYSLSGWTTTATTTNTGAGYHWTTTSLDGLGRTVSVQTGYGTTTVSEVDTTYAPCACNPVGKTSSQSQPYLPGSGTPPATTYTYDALGRGVSVLLPDAASHTQYIYQGNVTTVVDSAGNWKQYFSDSFGNLVTVLEPDPTANPVPGAPNPPPAYPVTTAPAGMLLTSYTYDQVSHLTQVSMPRNVAGAMKTQIRASFTTRQRSACPLPPTPRTERSAMPTITTERSPARRTPTTTPRRTTTTATVG